MKEDTIQHLASEMDELQEQHRDVLAKVRSFSDICVSFVSFLMKFFFTFLVIWVRYIW